jgi:hypothetical protein
MHYTDYRHCDLQDSRAVDLRAHMSLSGVIIDVCITIGVPDAFMIVYTHTHDGM